MKSAPLILSLLLLLILANRIAAQDLLQFMQQRPEIKQIEEISGNHSFKHTYEIKVRQPLNYADTTAGFFLQRVFVSDKQAESPTVLITEGYDADYAADPAYINELTEILKANQICIEHRYFGESYPDSIVWKYLTVENAANDDHRIVELFKPYFEGKWLNTGISKGGQTALAHRTFFPDDVSLTVAYVAPLNFGVEDGRHEVFLKTVGTQADRDSIQNFQLEILKRRESMTVLLKELCEQKGWDSKLSYDQMLDFMVLEYSFAFWQWGYHISQIPPLKSNDEELFAHFIKVSEPGYFTIQGSKKYQSFFYQAARELGYYGYDTEPFKEYLSISTAKGYLNRYMLPVDHPVEYQPETSLQVDKYLKNDARNVLLIYGETDPWSASAAKLNNDPSMIKIIAPSGSHSTRIKSLSPTTKNDAIAFIRSVILK
ncbi:S28 family serine protease [Mangrovibacterium diazotrophicum]|uniref:PS-10 peptidase S37 n=1 Tax=Mangrovibacterium diazotrophicum TaxID=1261403 RepID=A0A419W8X5_9BACT|nr:S28 family serine protease [Mangrovibacterium diazotrophicum]RKD91899.1 PS-10 peptidase S37 [Mangrovibacterium diazotrophicum]